MRAKSSLHGSSAERVKAACGGGRRPRRQQRQHPQVGTYTEKNPNYEVVGQSKLTARIGRGECGLFVSKNHTRRMRLPLRWSMPRLNL